MVKYLLPYGVAGRIFTSFEDAQLNTYMTKEGGFPPTPFIHPDNPYSDEFKNAFDILEIGPGIGRNLPYIKKHNEEGFHCYIGIEPNPTMRPYFWQFLHQQNIPTSGVELFGEFPYYNFEVDYIISTFVFQHLGYRPTPPYMNVDDITQSLNKYAHSDTVWYFLEHDREEPGWIEKWFKNNNITPEVYIRDWTGAPELNDRGLHHLIIFKGKLND